MDENKEIIETGAETGAPNVEPTEEAKPTLDEILKKYDLQSEYDRRQSKGINTALTKERERLAAVHAKELTEAERVARMTAEEKADYMQTKRDRELAEKEAELTRRELAIAAKSLMAERGLSLDLADLVDYSSESAMKASVDRIETTFRGAVSNAVAEKIKGTEAPPKDARTENVKDKNPDEMTDEEFYAARKKRG